MRGIRRAAAGCALAVALACGVSIASAAPPPVEAFARLPNFSDPLLSPDGRYVAAIQSVNGRSVLAIYEGSNDPVVVPSVDGTQIGGIRWLKADRLAVYLMTGRRVDWDRMNLLRTWARTAVISPDGSNVVILLSSRDDAAYNVGVTSIADVALDQPDHIYMPFYNASQSSGKFRRDLLRVNVRTGRGSLYLKGTYDTRQWIMDGQGGVIGRIDLNDERLEQTLYLRNGEDWRAAATYDMKNDEGAGVAGLTADGSALVRYASSGGTFGLVKMDIATGKQSVLFHEPTYDVSSLYFDDWTGRVIGASYIADTPETVFFDREWQYLQNGLRKAFPGLSVIPLSVSRDRSKAIVVTDGPQSPPKFYYLDRTSHEASLLAESYPDLRPEHLGAMKAYPYKARDGLPIHAYLTLPPGGASRNLPLVVMPHGGPEARDAIGFDWWAQFLASRGYAVLQPNFRGSTGYGKAFQMAGRGQWGLKMQDDVTDGVMKAIADGIADPRRVCIVGASYGGYAALAGAAFTPDLYACAVSVSGVSNLGDLLRYARKQHGRDSAEIAMWAQRIGSDDPDSKALEKVSPVTRAAAVKCPILLMHPALDTTVPKAQSEDMADALEDEGKQVTYIEMEGDDHYLQLGSTRLQMLTELEKFLAAHIGR